MAEIPETSLPYTEARAAARGQHVARTSGGRRTPPPDTRPYRYQHESGVQMRTMTLQGNQTWRQVGWHGQSGAFYALDERPADHEPGSYAPLWQLIENEPPILDEEIDHG